MLREAIETPQKLYSFSRKLSKDLDQGCYFGKEIAIAQTVAPVWQACPQDPETIQALWSLFSPISSAINIEAPELFRRLFMETPLACIEKKPDQWELWFPILKSYLRSPDSYTISRLMEIAQNTPNRLNQLVHLFGEKDFRNFPALTATQIDLIVDHAGYEIRELPNIFARLPGRSGIEALLRLAEREHFTIPPELLRSPGIDPATFVPLIRSDAVMALKGRKLMPQELRRVFALALADEELIADSAIKVLAEQREELRKVTLPEKVLDHLASRMRLSERACGQLAGILATQGRRGAKHLYAFWIKTLEGQARGCGWDLEEALREVAPHLRNEFVQRYHTTKDPQLIPYLVAAEETALVAEIARTAPDNKVRGEAIRQLAEYLPDHPDDTKAREALRRAALEALNGFAWEALIKVKDAKVNWDRLVAMLKEGTFDFEPLLRMFPKPAPQSVLEALLDLAFHSPNPLARTLAVGAALRTPEWALRELSASYLPEEKEKEKKIKDKARAVLQYVYALEPKLRALFNHPDDEVRRSATGWFTVVPAQEVATTKALLLLLDDPNKYVRANASDALSRAKTVEPGMVTRLEERIARGDPDENVVRSMERAWISLLCKDPEAMDRLVDLVLHRKGDAKERKQLAKAGALEPPIAQALLARLDAEPVKAWLPKKGLSLKVILQGEEDPPPWELISHLVPETLRNAWLVKKAEETKLAWDLRLRILLMISGKTAEPVRQRMHRLWVEAFKADVVAPAHFLDGYIRHFGYEGIQKLVDTFWDNSKLLEKLAQLCVKANNISGLRSATGLSSRSTPKPDKEHLPWIAQHIKELAKTRDARRLRAFLTISEVFSLGSDWKLQRAAYEAGITPALLSLIHEPEWCRACQPLNSLLGRILPPRCPKR